MSTRRVCPSCNRPFEANDFDAATGWWECRACRVRVRGQTGPGDLTGEEITASLTTAASVPPTPEESWPVAPAALPNPAAATVPDLTPILRRVQKLERQRNVMLAGLAVAVVVAGFSLWRSGSQGPQPALADEGKVIKTERVVFLDANGRPGPSVAVDADGMDGLAFYSGAGVKLAKLEEWPKIETAFQLFGPGDRVGVSLIVGKDRSKLELSGPNEEGSATLAVTKNGSKLDLDGPNHRGIPAGQATASFGVSRDKPALWLTHPNGGTVQLDADENGSSLGLHDNRECRVIIDGKDRSSGLTVYGPGKMNVSASVFKGKDDGKYYPSVDVTDANGRTVFETP
jgi:hypothetical protein